MFKLLIMFTLIIGVFEWLPLIKRQKWPELTVAGIITLLIFLIFIGKLVGLQTPLELMDNWLHPLGAGIFKRF